MTDPRLNSVHLPPARRDDFRVARDTLLNNSGSQTLAGKLPNGIAATAPTFAQQPTPPFPVNVLYVLMDKENVYPLKIGVNTVGRMPDNDVVVPDPYVSRRHVAIVVHTDNFCEMQDFASKNGTLLNGATIDGPTKLKSGDQIVLSDHLLIFLSRADALQDQGEQTIPIES